MELLAWACWGLGVGGFHSTLLRMYGKREGSSGNSSSQRLPLSHLSDTSVLAVLRPAHFTVRGRSWDERGPQVMILFFSIVPEGQKGTKGHQSLPSIPSIRAIILQVRMSRLRSLNFPKTHREVRAELSPDSQSGALSPLQVSSSLFSA